MAQQLIDIGDKPADGSGDPIRVSFDKTNQNFTEIYNEIASILAGGGTPGAYVSSVAGKTGAVQLNTADVIGAVTQGYVDNRVQYEIQQQIGALLDGVPAELNTLQKLSAAIANNPGFYYEVFTQIAAKLSLSGGIMTGRLTMSVDPVASMEVATKQYVDNKLNIGVAPTSAIGQSGDYQGKSVVDASFLYVCTQHFDGVTPIWTRTPLNSAW